MHAEPVQDAVQIKFLQIGDVVVKGFFEASAGQPDAVCGRGCSEGNLEFVLHDKASFGLVEFIIQQGQAAVNGFLDGSPQRSE